jgi:hypothetical protein
MARISQEVGHPRDHPLQVGKGWRREEEVVPASKKEPEDWGATDELTVVLGTAGPNATELRTYCRERCLFPKQV